ncbi:hypothetical protein GCM10019059_08390 [Camelimonas fluminis]|nr:hypothetical protein GCM10019059_08390 [Camelimonas fluminis]
MERFPANRTPPHVGKARNLKWIERHPVQCERILPEQARSGDGAAVRFHSRVEAARHQNQASGPPWRTPQLLLTPGGVASPRRHQRMLAETVFLPARKSSRPQDPAFARTLWVCSPSCGTGRCSEASGSAKRTGCFMA